MIYEAIIWKIRCFYCKWALQKRDFKSELVDQSKIDLIKLKTGRIKNILQIYKADKTELRSLHWRSLN